MEALESGAPELVIRDLVELFRQVQKTAGCIIGKAPPCSQTATEGRAGA